MNSTSDHLETRVAGQGCRTAARSRWLMGLAALSVVLYPSSHLFAQVSYDMYANYNPTNTLDTGSFSSEGTADSSISFSRPVGDLLTIGNNKSYSTSSGYADAGNLKLGVSGWAVSKAGNSQFTDTHIYTDASNQFTLLPGTSGLSLGDTTTLNLKIRLDGSLSADAKSWPGKSWAHADIEAAFGLKDLSVVIPAEGESHAYSPTLAEFSADASLEAYDIYKPYWGYSYASPWEESWGAESNLISPISHDAEGENTETTEGMYFTGVGRQFDTGYLNISFEAVVGHTMGVNAYMASYVNANNEAEAWADFDNTFSFGVTPTVTGTQIDWMIPGDTQTVPDSGGLSLVGIALLALAGLSRIRALRRA